MLTIFVFIFQIFSQPSTVNNSTLHTGLLNFLLLDEVITVVSTTHSCLCR